MMSNCTVYDPKSCAPIDIIGKDKVSKEALADSIFRAKIRCSFQKLCVKKIDLVNYKITCGE